MPYFLYTLVLFRTKQGFILQGGTGRVVPNPLREQRETKSRANATTVASGRAEDENLLK